MCCFAVEYLNDLFTLKRNLSNGRARGTRGPLREHPSSIHLNPLPPTCHPPPFFFPTNFGKVNGKNVKIIGSVSNTFVIQSVDLGTWLVWSIDFFFLVNQITMISAPRARFGVTRNFDFPLFTHLHSPPSEKSKPPLCFSQILDQSQVITLNPHLLGRLKQTW